jgi:hypothetical protein
MTTATSRYEDMFAPDELPVVLGSPAVPKHPFWRRVGYTVTGLFAGSMASLGNGLVTANSTPISGGLGLYAYETSFLTALYFGMNASANLTLVKARAQFGIPVVIRAFLGAYIAAALLQLAYPSFATECLVRAASGVTGGGLTALAVHYIVQDFSKATRPLGVAIGISLTQFGIPIARLFPLEFLSEHSWLRLDLIELAIPLTLLALTSAFPLPPVRCQKAFERLDFLVIALMLPAFVMLSLVFSEGRLLWWTDTPWLGAALATAILLIGTAIIVERLRSRPLLRFEWISSIDIVRFAAIALFVRFALAEQTFGSVGFLSTGGLTDDQLHTLFELVLLGVVLGIGTMAMFLSERNVPYLIMAAALMIATAGFWDSFSNSLTRPHELYFTQFLIGYGTTLFIGPAFLSGLIQLLKKGDEYFVSLVVVFSVTQNLGSVAGSALVSSLQIYFTQLHTHRLLEQMSGWNSAVLHRLGEGKAAVSPWIADSSLQTKEGAALLIKSLQLQAQALAYDDIFRVISVFALGIAFYAAYIAIRNARASRAPVGGSS